MILTLTGIIPNLEEGKKKTLYQLLLKQQAEVFSLAQQYKLL